MDHERTSPRSNTYTGTSYRFTYPRKKGGATLCLPLGDFILIPKMGIVYSLTLKKGHLRYLESPGALHLEIGHIPCQEIHNAFAKNLRVSGMSWMSSRFSTCQNIVCKEHLQNWRQFLTQFFFGASFGTANISPIYCSIGV